MSEESVVATSWHSAPEIYAIGHKRIRELFDGDVEVQEKVDGSFIQFGKHHGELLIKSQGRDIHLDMPANMFVQAVEAIKRMGPDLKEGWTYRGEYLSKPHHNMLAYDRTPKNWIIIFDILRGQEDYLNHEEKQAESERLGLEVVPLIHRGDMNSIDHLDTFLDRDSVLGKMLIEGVVIKNYHLTGLDNKVLMGKYVSKRFKEKHDKELESLNKKPGPGDILKMLADTYTTQARWVKAVQHLQEDGRITDTPEDIGPLVREVQVDLIKECQDEIKDRLWDWARNNVKLSVINGLPEWYKELLAKKFGPVFGDSEIFCEKTQDSLLKCTKDDLITPSTGSEGLVAMQYHHPDGTELTSQKLDQVMGKFFDTQGQDNEQTLGFESLTNVHKLPDGSNLVWEASDDGHKFYYHVKGDDSKMVWDTNTPLEVMGAIFSMETPFEMPASLGNLMNALDQVIRNSADNEMDIGDNRNYTKCCCKGGCGGQNHGQNDG